MCSEDVGIGVGLVVFVWAVWRVGYAKGINDVVDMAFMHTHLRDTFNQQPEVTDKLMRASKVLLRRMGSDRKDN